MWSLREVRALEQHEYVHRFAFCGCMYKPTRRGSRTPLPSTANAHLDGPFTSLSATPLCTSAHNPYIVHALHLTCLIPYLVNPREQHWTLPFGQTSLRRDHPPSGNGRHKCLVRPLILVFTVCHFERTPTDETGAQGILFFASRGCIPLPSPVREVESSVRSLWSHHFVAMLPRPTEPRSRCPRRFRRLILRQPLTSTSHRRYHRTRRHRRLPHRL